MLHYNYPRLFGKLFLRYFELGFIKYSDVLLAFQKFIDRQKVGIKLISTVMHGDGNSGFHPADYCSCAGWTDCIFAANRNEQYIDVADRLDLGRRQLMPQVTEMAQTDMIDRYDEYDVPATLGPVLFIVIRRHAGDVHTLDGSVTDTGDYSKALRQTLYAGMIGMGVGDCDDIRSNSYRAVLHGAIETARFVWIGDNLGSVL